jgi:hypothetical protein
MIPESHRVAVAVAVAVVAVAATAAVAQKRTTSYQVRFESVANNCRGTGIALSRAGVDLIAGPGTQLAVTIPMIPMMRGSTSKGGKFSARARRGKTGIAGLEGKFSIAGSVDAADISFVFVAEYYRGKEPLCTQSWKGSGKRTK